MVRKPFLARSDSVNSTSFNTKRETDYWLLNECESAFPPKPQGIDTFIFRRRILARIFARSSSMLKPFTVRYLSAQDDSLVNGQTRGSIRIACQSQTRVRSLK